MTLIWEGPNSLGGFTAKIPEGSWRLSAPSDVAKLNFTMSRPDGAGFVELMNNHKMLQAESPWSKEAQYASALCSIGSTEIAYAESIEEGQHLAEMLSMNHGEGSYEDILKENGFALKYPGHESENIRGMWCRNTKGGLLTANIRNEPGNRFIHATYEGNRSSYWHNIMRITQESMNHDNTFVIYNFFPEALNNIYLAGLKHFFWVLEERQKREKTRISTPLGGAIPRISYA